MHNYVELAQVTNTVNYKDGMGRMLIATILNNIIEAGGALDAVKKFQFYGRETEETKGLIEQQTHEAIYSTDDWCDMPDFAKLFPDLPREYALKVYHGIVGKITEAVELAEMLRDALVEHKPVDITNLIEEVGDGQWYDASIASGLRMPSFDQFQVVNIAKLTKRFGGKFDAYKAQQENRDLDAERKVLEGSNDIPPHVQRMLAEVDELHTRLEGLRKFIGTETFLNLGLEEQSDMKSQERAMAYYHDSLRNRIDRALNNA